jgi:ADP-heptose:LPS heptosyltransferase
VIVSPPRLGDVALAIPAIRSLRASYPHARLGIVAPRPLQALVAWTCRPDLLVDTPSGLSSAHATRAALSAQGWDLALDLTTDYHLAAARLAAATRAPVRIGFEHSGRGRFFQVALPLDEGEHMADTFARAAGAAGARTEAGPLPGGLPAEPLPLPPRPAGGRLIGLHPGATHPTQRWPPQSFGELAKALQAGGNVCVVLGGEGDRALVEEVLEASAGAALRVGAGDVLQLAATLRGLDLVVANNSGPLHLAGLVGVPTLSFMGPTVRERWWPRGSRARVLRLDELPCIGCNLGWCKIGTHACMTGIASATAAAACQEILGRSP